MPTVAEDELYSPDRGALAYLLHLQIRNIQRRGSTIHSINRNQLYIEANSNEHYEYKHCARTSSDAKSFHLSQIGFADRERVIGMCDLRRRGIQRLLLRLFVSRDK
jgi:hypothetical protein